jgi:pSer/pThr/pTyr-binding forkhead associated (FHA) protein
MKKASKQRLTKYEEPEFCLINLQSNRRTPLVHKVTIIGRNPNLLVQVNDVSVSSKHASIEMNDEFSKAYLQDKGALNGCWIND